MPNFSVQKLLMKLANKAPLLVQASARTVGSDFQLVKFCKVHLCIISTCYAHHKYYKIDLFHEIEMVKADCKSEAAGYSCFIVGNKHPT
jgi:hypothetical protein